MLEELNLNWISGELPLSLGHNLAMSCPGIFPLDPCCSDAWTLTTTTLRSAETLLPNFRMLLRLSRRENPRTLYTQWFCQSPTGSSNPQILKILPPKLRKQSWAKPQKAPAESTFVCLMLVMGTSGWLTWRSKYFATARQTWSVKPGPPLNRDFHSKHPSSLGYVLLG